MPDAGGDGREKRLGFPGKNGCALFDSGSGSFIDICGKESYGAAKRDKQTAE